MDPNENTPWITKVLGLACMALTGALALVTRKKKQPPRVCPPVHSTESLDRLVEIAETFKNFAENFKGQIQNLIKEDRLRVDAYHVRLGDVEDDVIDLKTKMEGLMKAELPALWNDMHKVEDNALNTRERLSNVEGSMRGMK